MPSARADMQPPFPSPLSQVSVRSAPRRAARLETARSCVGDGQRVRGMAAHGPRAALSPMFLTERKGSR